MMWFLNQTDTGKIETAYVGRQVASPWWIPQKFIFETYLRLLEACRLNWRMRYETCRDAARHNKKREGEIFGERQNVFDPLNSKPASLLYKNWDARLHVYFNFLSLFSTSYIHIFQLPYFNLPCSKFCND